MIAYETVRDDVVLLEHWSGHLSMLVVVMLDEIFIAHARLLLDEDGGLDDFAEAGGVGIACLQDHDKSRIVLDMDVQTPPFQKLRNACLDT